MGTLSLLFHVAISAQHCVMQCPLTLSFHMVCGWSQHSISLRFGWTLVHVFTNLTVSVTDKGLITPISFQMPDSHFVRLTVASLIAASWAIVPEEVVELVRAELALSVTNRRHLVRWEMIQSSKTHWIVFNTTTVQQRPLHWCLEEMLRSCNAWTVVGNKNID